MAACVVYDREVKMGMKELLINVAGAAVCWKVRE